MVFTDNGHVGVGTAEPKANLEVAQGDVYLSEVGSGVILTSPSGETCARLGIDDAGVMTTETIECP